MKNLKFTSLALLIFFVSSCAVDQTRFEATYGGINRATMQGKLKEALADYESGARESEKNAATSLFSQQHWLAAARANYWAARAARLIGDLQKSVAHANKAAELVEKLEGVGPDDRLVPINELVYTYRHLRDFEKTKEQVQKGLKISRQYPRNSDDREFWEGQFLAQQGIDFIREREFHQAIDVLSESVRLQESFLSSLSRPRYANASLIVNNRIDLVWREIRLGDAYRRAGKTQDALDRYQQALNHIKEWGLSYPWLHELYWELGTLHRQRKNFSEALEYYQQALDRAESQRVSGGIAAANIGIGDVLRQMGKPKEAAPRYQRALQQIESTRSLLQSEEYRQSYFEGSLVPYTSMMLALLEMGRQEEAFNYNERARSRVFLDVLGSRVQLSKATSGLFEEERVLQERIAAIKARVANAGEAGRPGLQRDLAESEKLYTDFLTRVRKKNKEQASLLNVEPLTVKQVQELLDPGVTMLEYFVTPDIVILWVVEKDKLTSINVPLRRGQLQTRVSAIREAMQQFEANDKFKKQAEDLFRFLIQPSLPHITGTQLVIVPHDVLHYLPFQTLLGSDGRYLIEKYPINYLSSASLLQFAKEKSGAMGKKVLAFGNPDLNDPKMALQFAEIEAKEIQTLYPQASIYLAKEATEEKAKTLSPQNDIIHFASHAELNENDPLSSAVLLAKSDKEDGRLEVREIFGMDLKASLVVLSACETGLGKLSSGDELVGLTRAFIYAGTPSVVASLWKVEDSSTAQLMASFYRNLKTMSKVEALRQAQLELIRGQASSDLLARRGIGGIGKLGEVPEGKSQSQDSVSISTAHPYFWAPFILVGDGK